MSTADSGAPGSAPAAVLGMLAGMRAAGVDVGAACAAAGVSEASLAQRTAPLPLAELAPIWQAAVKQFGRGTLGLHVGAAIPTGSLLDYVAGSSANLRAALGQVARYIGLSTRNIRWALGPREADGLTMFEEQVTVPGEAVPPALREFSVSLAASRMRLWVDRGPREVWFGHAAQGPVEEYRQVFRCPVSFDRDRVGLRYDDEALAAPAHRHDPALVRILEAHAERVLAETPAPATFRERVRREVVQRLREGEPSMAGIAETLATSERSLQRKLQAEGVSFRDVVDEARHKLAVIYLGDATLSLTDVACLLGYSEAAAFTRAFKRWTGQAPSQARR